MKTLTQEFYNQSPLIVAQALLGKVIVRRVNNQKLRARIIETEAYLGFEDPASHGYKGKTKRNQSLFLSAGHAYVYQIHRSFCFNVVTSEENIPGGVLVRSILPLVGFNNQQKIVGPGRLAKAMHIDNKLDGADLTTSKEIFIAQDGYNTLEIFTSPRIGISQAKEELYRFYLTDAR